MSNTCELPIINDFGPPCEYRTVTSMKIKGGDWAGWNRVLCSHQKQRHRFNIVKPKTCLACVWRDVPCEPRAIAPTVSIDGRMIALEWWKFGSAISRALKWLSFGLIKPKPGCGCQQRAWSLDGWIERDRDAVLCAAVGCALGAMIVDLMR